MGAVIGELHLRIGSLIRLSLPIVKSKEGFDYAGRHAVRAAIQVELGLLLHSAEGAASVVAGMESPINCRRG
jgi:hypothetical protein